MTNDHATPDAGPTPPRQAGAPQRPAPARPSRRPWVRAVRGAMLGVAGIFMLLLVAAVGLVAVHDLPFRSARGWPFALTQRTNVLIMGLDRTVSDQNPNIVYPVSRTDTLIAASFDPVSHRVNLLSVPRDTRATIPGHGATKINAAHAWGGVPLTIRTVENFLGVRFPYFIEMTERGYVRLIDAVGGVNIRIDKDLNYDDNWDGLHIHLKKGYRRLGGKAAMEYARFRHDPLGDIGRIRRQQDVMNALLDELRRPQVIMRVGRILKVFREDVNTNLSEDQLVALALFGARLPSGGLVRETLPGSFGGDWLPDAARDREMVARMFYGIPADALSRTTVEVIADPASRDAAADAQARLAALGIPVVRVRTETGHGPTAVIVHRGDPSVANVAAALFDTAVVEGSSAGGADLTIQFANAAIDVPAVPLSR